MSAPAPFDFYERAYLTCSGFLIVHALWATLRLFPFDKLLPWMYKTTRIIYESMCAATRRVDEDSSAVDKYLMDKMFQLQQTRLSYTFALGYRVLTMFMGQSCYMILARVEPWRTWQQDVLLACGALACVILNRCCRFASRKGVYASHALVMIFSLLWVQLSDIDSVRAAGGIMQMIAVRLAMTLTYVRPQAVAFWIITCTCADFYKTLGTRNEASAIAGVDVQGPVLVVDLIVCVMAISFSMWLRTTALDELSQGLITSTQKIDNSALHILMENVFDEVLPLDSQFQIRSNADKMTQMYTFDTETYSHGTDFTELITVEEERGRFRYEFSAEAVEVSPVVSNLKLHMRNGNGSNVRFDVTGVAFANVYNEMNYVIGLRDVSKHKSLSSSDVQSEKARKRSRSKTSRHGTPRANPSNSLNAADDSSDTSSVVSGSRTKLLAVPRFKLTTMEGKEASLLDLVTSWNTDISNRKCCAYHATLPRH
eukprot:TRINITY_DN8249_c0_g3_i3.p1 TRINITY_DN8249_c0_g3~~TRINITY_DN8249_c0_g3_i3.p1  ORF type:complete len:483 (+),score=34.04 TRINITY_DN8249_c0_g3_i3:94-1542(+)